MPRPPVRAPFQWAWRGHLASPESWGVTAGSDLTRLVCWEGGGGWGCVCGGLGRCHVKLTGHKKHPSCFPRSPFRPLRRGWRLRRALGRGGA